MTHKTILKIAECIAIVAALSTLLLTLTLIWGNVISDHYMLLTNLLNTSLVVLLSAGLVTTLTRDLLLSEKHRRLSMLAYLSHNATVLTTIVVAIILLPMSWGLLSANAVLIRILGSLATFFVMALVITRLSGVSSHRFKGESVTA
jgi:hypothetical protein